MRVIRSLAGNTLATAAMDIVPFLVSTPASMAQIAML